MPFSLKEAHREEGFGPHHTLLGNTRYSHELTQAKVDPLQEANLMPLPRFLLLTNSSSFQKVVAAYCGASSQVKGSQLSLTSLAALGTPPPQDALSPKEGATES